MRELRATTRRSASDRRLAERRRLVPMRPTTTAHVDAADRDERWKTLRRLTHRLCLLDRRRQQSTAGKARLMDRHNPYLVRPPEVR